MDAKYIRNGRGEEYYDIDTPIEEIYIIIEPSENEDSVCIYGCVAGTEVYHEVYTYDEDSDYEYNQSVFMEMYAKIFGVAAEYYMCTYGFEKENNLIVKKR
mgnify:FL=1